MIRAPLHTLRIHTASSGGRRYWTPSALEAFLPHFAPTLETFELRNLFITMSDARGLDGSPPGRFVLPLTQYPAVRSLYIRDLDGVPLLDVLMHLFPAIDGTLRIGEWGSITGLSDHAHIRECNREAQQRRAWTKLDRLICDAELFHLLGLRCPIGHLMIDNWTDDVKDDLALALRECPVARLKLSLLLSPGLGVFDALRSAGLEGTSTYLTLCLVDIRFNEEIQVQDADGMTPTGLPWDDILDGVRFSVAPLQKLVHLRIVVHSSIFNHVPEEAARFMFAHTSRHCTAVSFKRVSASLAGRLQSLQSLFVTMSVWFGNVSMSKTGGSFPAPGVSQSAGKLTLVRLTDEARTAIIQKEELFLSRSPDEIELQPVTRD
ncbi:hypothetical protein GSI_14453 [Ganoderma sinense ZZ0214-1]|uniref:Uncharacterized protein n=1 Tax=Ganoderma sinense ZZ0214-1 TaxID=1077348 RepID=A0A2G8RNQ0_9APHY|nr:hypothetical protein GSI_14453 [Ganoderma sinense ZZ0214-1]